MSKIFETDTEIVKLAEEKWSETGLEHIGINIKYLSVPKSKTILKAQRASATTNFLTKKDVIITVFEEAFERLTDEHKNLLLEGCMSNISYDAEKDKWNVETDFAKEILRMRHKYPNYVDVAEESLLIIESIEDEERRRKEEEKLAKKEKKNKK
jgi:hypothetical protein